VAWVLLARRLGSAQFGQLSVWFLSARWLGLVADWGAAQYGSRDVAAGDVRSSIHLRDRRTEISLVSCALFLLAAGVTGAWWAAPLVAVILASGLNRDWIAVGEGRGRAGAVPLVVRAFALAVGSLFIGALTAASLLIAGSYLSWLVVSLVLNRHRDWPRFGWERPVAPPWGLVIVLGAQVYTTLDVLLLDRIRGTDEAGVYNAIYRIPLGVNAMVGLLVVGLLPVLAGELHGSSEAFGDLRRKMTWLGVAGGVGVLGLTPLAVVSVPILFGAEYTDGQAPLALLMAATAVSTVGAPIGSLLLAVGRERPIALIVSGGAVVNLVLNLVLIPPLGMIGASATTAISEMLVIGGEFVLLSSMAEKEV